MSYYDPKEDVFAILSQKQLAKTGSQGQLLPSNILWPQ